MKNYSLAISTFIEVIQLKERLRTEDFLNIWEEISKLDSDQILVKRNWIYITLEYYQKKYGKCPIIGFTKGLDFSTLEYQLKLIREALENGK